MRVWRQGGQFPWTNYLSSLMSENQSIGLPFFGGDKQ